jgi:hypothetical protein
MINLELRLKHMVIEICLRTPIETGSGVRNCVPAVTRLKSRLIYPLRRIIINA